jgi:hypothetical protein
LVTQFGRFNPQLDLLYRFSRASSAASFLPLVGPLLGIGLHLGAVIRFLSKNLTRISPFRWR